MGKHGLHLEKKFLAAFLSRCSVSANKDGTIPYREFLHRFQDRSEQGMTHNILTNHKHRLVRLLVFYFITYMCQFTPRVIVSTALAPKFGLYTIYNLLC